jgi:hypothetical protein
MWGLELSSHHLTPIDTCEPRVSLHLLSVLLARSQSSLRIAGQQRDYQVARVFRQEMWKPQRRRLYVFQQLLPAR